MARPRKAQATLPPFIHVVMAKGRPYYYFERKASASKPALRVRLPGVPYDENGLPSEDWWASYRQAVDSKAAGPRAGTFAALIDAYQASPEWKNLSPRTRGERVRDLQRIIAMWGSLQVRGLEARHVFELRDSIADRPAAANNLLRTLSAMLSWSIPRGWRPTNPCDKVKKLPIGDGYDPWSWDEIEHFRTHAPAYMWLAAAVALYTGQRLSDVLKMLWTEIEAGHIGLIQNKTGKRLLVPLHANLKAILKNTPRTAPTIVTTSRGQPWTVDGFKASWQRVMDAPEMAGLRKAGRVFHGLRKSAVVMLLEAGCTDAEVSSITGQSRDMVEHYARQVNQRRLSAAAILKWEKDAKPKPVAADEG